MKSFVAGAVLVLLLFVFVFMWLHRVGREPRHTGAGPDATYRAHLALSADTAANPPLGAPEENLWVDKVRKAFSPFTVANVETNFPLAYAERFYFRDAFHHFTDRDAMIAYMRRSAEMSPGVTFEYGPVARQGIDFYLPWTMVLGGKNPQRSLGMSHLRFNEDGQVIFHQDYWDSADVLVPRVPVANGLIELVRRRF
jgi:hypothetical protein